MGLGLTLAIAIGACGRLDDDPVLRVENGTSQAIDVVLRYPGGDVDVATDLQPGQSIGHDRMGGCDDAVLIAYDQDGVELMRSGPPICRPSTVVIIEPA